MLNGTDIQNVVVNFGKVDNHGFTVLGSFLTFRKTVGGWNGRMAFCNVSDHEKDMRQITNLDHLWPICSSRSEALEAVTGNERLSAC